MWPALCVSLRGLATTGDTESASHQQVVTMVHVSMMMMMMMVIITIIVIKATTGLVTTFRDLCKVQKAPSANCAL